MLKLYEISDLYNEFVRMVDDGEIDDPQAITDTLEGIKQEFDDKCESIACLFKALSKEAEDIEDEAKALMARAKYKRNVCDHLKDYLAASMQSVGQSKLERPRVKLSFRKSESLEITDEIALQRGLTDAERLDLLRIVVERKFDKTAIKKAIKDGTMALPGCTIVTKDNLLIK